VDRAGFWRHCLASACAAEMLAERLGARAWATPGQAYVAGLLHDLGKLALEALLPRCYARVAQIADERQCDIAEVERLVLGLDHHLVGKRLAEHWGLPHALQDAMWLHSQPEAALPDLPHRPLIGVVTVADALARRQHIGWSGNFAAIEGLDSLAARLGLEETALERIERELHAGVARRAELIGLNGSDDAELLSASIAAANRQLARLMQSLEQRSRAGATLARSLQTIAEFHGSVAEHRTLASTLGEVARSAAKTLGATVAALLWQDRPEAPWSIHRFGADGRLLESRALPAPPPWLHPRGAATGDSPADLAQLLSGPRHDVRSASALAWVAEQCRDVADASSLGLLKLPAGWGPSVMLAHNGRSAEAVLGSAGAAE
jgi:HD superfamily phosphohydrolase YqeK